MPPTPSKINNVEWGLVITAAAVLDCGQVFLDLLGIGFFLNPFIDISVGIILPLYCYFRGIKMGPKQILSILSAFGLEMVIPGGALPLWVFDVILIMIWEKAEHKIENAAPIAHKLALLAHQKGYLDQPPRNNVFRGANGKYQPVPPRIASSSPRNNETGTTTSEEVMRNVPPLKEQGEQTVRVPQKEKLEAQKKPNNTVDLRDEFSHKTDNVIDLHGRSTGKKDKYREVA